MLQIALIFASVIFGVWSAEQYPDITQCKQNDAVCLTRNTNKLYKMAVAGDPNLNIDNLDPIKYRKLVANLPRVKYTIFNSTSTGLTGCDVVKTNLNLKKSTLQLNLVCPTLFLYGFYEMSGVLITLPIEGTGNFIAICIDYRIQIDAKINVVQNKNGEKFMSLKDYEIEADLQRNMVTDLLSFDYGKRDFVKVIRAFINENWKPISKELQGPVINATFKKVIKNMNKYLKTIPLHQLILQ